MDRRWERYVDCADCGKPIDKKKDGYVREVTVIYRHGGCTLSKPDIPPDTTQPTKDGAVPPAPSSIFREG